MKILLIDNDFMTLTVYMRAFSKYFPYVVALSNARDGLARLEVEQFDVVISDIFLKEMNGIELAKQVKLRNKNTLFIISTSSTDENYRILAGDNGVDFYCKKPSAQSIIDFLLEQKPESVGEEYNYLTG